MTQRKMILLYVSIAVLQITVKAQQTIPVAQQNKVPLMELSGFSQKIYYSPGHEERAKEIAARSGKALNYFYGLFGFKPNTNLYILSQADWKDYASSTVYGMPHFSDSAKLVIAAEDNDFWRSFLPPVDKLPAPLAAKVKAAYGRADGSYSMMPFFDLLALHELGHGFHNQVKLKMHRKWMGELFVNILLHTYIAENEPGLLPALQTFPEMVVGAGSAEYKFTSLADFERLYEKMGMGPKNYGWYQCNLHNAGKNIYNAGGVEVIKKLWTALKIHQTSMSDEAFVNMLSSEVHQAVADVYLKWNQ